MPTPKLHIANVHKDIAIDGQYLLKEFISKLAILFKLNSTRQRELTKSFQEGYYLKKISPRNLSGDGIRFIAIRNWVRHNALRDIPPLPA